MTHYRLLVALAAVVAGLFLITAASADHSWGTYHWARTSNPFTLQLEDDLTTTEWDGFLGNVSSDWSQSTVLDTTVVDKAATKNCSAIKGKIRVCNKKYGYNGWLGLATIWLSGGHIYQGTSKVNDSYFGLSAYNNPYLKRHVLCQEVGHTFGLGHQHGVTDSCMNDEGSTFFLASAVSPNQHDYDQLVAIYGSHTDSSNSFSTAAAAGGPGRGAGEDAVPAGADPQHGNVFVRELGGGRTMVTFVIWAPVGR